MAETGDAFEWDFITLSTAWNLYGLTALLVIVTVAVMVKGRSRHAASFGQDSIRTVRRIGLIHCALSVHALIALVQELLTIRTMGIPESHAGLISGIISTAMNPVLAVGVLRRWSWARRLAIGWYAFLSLLAILVIVWRWYYHVAFDPAAWPELAATKVMPLFLFVVMLLPRIERVFARRPRPASFEDKGKNPAESLASESAPGEVEVEPQVGWTVVSLVTLLFLIVVCSNFIVDAADSGYRLLFTVD
jgi:hypothetical protein